MKKLDDTTRSWRLEQAQLDFLDSEISKNRAEQNKFELERKDLEKRLENPPLPRDSCRVVNNLRGSEINLINFQQSATNRTTKPADFLVVE